MMTESRLQSIIANYPPKDGELVIGAYKIAERALEGQMRANSIPFIEHPLGVASIVANEIGLMPEALAAVFLHEASRQNPQLFQELKKSYSAEIMTMVEGLNNISSITPKDTKLQAENYRKLIISYSKDPRVTLIKLADRLEVMRNMDLFPKSSIKRKITETMMLYIPLAHQLGLYNLKSELEDLYFKYADPESYRAITNKLKATEKDREILVEQFIKPLEETLRKRYTYKLKARTKTAYSIWKKMQKQGVPFEEVYDVFAIRFIVDAPNNKEAEHAYCWDIFSEVTKEYKQDTARLRDWITYPKPNGYESLHITVENKDGAKIEVQIRTARMDDVAENGHASHWSYKGIKSVHGLDSWLKSVKNMLESSDPNPYSGSNISLDEIFVFTPAGDLRELPKGATILDFAFSIHTNLGVKCSGAKVNGKVVSIREVLHTGDVVEIMSNKNQKPSPDWLNIAVSSKARGRIKSKLKEEEGKKSRIGREMLERRMKNWKMELNDDILSELTRHFKLKSIGELCMGISEEKIDLQDIKEHLSSLAQTQESESSQSASPQGGAATAAAQMASKVKSTSHAGEDDYLVISDKLDNISFKMAKCCNPIFGDDVFGFVSATGGIKIHRISCPNAKRLLENYPYRVQKVRWRQVSNTTRFQTGLKVIVVNGDLSVGNSIIDSINKQGAVLRAFRIEERTSGKEGDFNVMLSISVSNNGHLDRVISDLKKIRGVRTILRISAEK
ncbi:MAG: bifunctional (p)ppGpp synthetase/guanosine-3',5'-bis(diphosphate) 3'-pyrophosphohydrolase [Bacteroidales bacterium]|nr:bifunctional (p)ppGpp synthetase/guanosine-3',5'-bis(diphosphate) 3'-pyrophosphohydrolase [Bacteroidales bacterium]